MKVVFNEKKRRKRKKGRKKKKRGLIPELHCSDSRKLHRFTFSPGMVVPLCLGVWGMMGMGKGGGGIKPFFFQEYGRKL